MFLAQQPQPQPQPQQQQQEIISAVDNIYKMCDIMELEHKYKNNIKMIKMIKKQYKLKALQLHPDRNENNTTALFQELNNAYTTLLNYNK